MKVSKLKRVLRRALRAVRGAPAALAAPVNVDELVLREATIEDLRPLAELHVKTFNETHVGPFGSGPTVETRTWQWRGNLLDIDATRFVYVLETPAKQLVGFIWCHPTDDNPEWAARLNKIYLLRAYQRRGLGQRLVKVAVERLVANGLTSMVLFTEADNEPACSFYDSLGGERMVGEKGEFEGMYGWRDLRALQTRLTGLP
jgi:ribosomal protein S18 acetylase RimI-like enzyme